MNENKKYNFNMWPIILGAGAIALLLKALFEDNEDTGKEFKKRIFISFAIEDEKYRDYLVSVYKVYR